MSVDNNIGYMICETASSEPQKPVIIDKVRDRVVIEAILQDLNIRNRNGRYYSTAELVPQLTCPRTMELLNAGGMPGEAGHPMEKDLSRQQTIDPRNVSHYITKLWNDGNDIKGHVRAARGEAGNLFNDTVLDGIKVAFSLRALGTVTNTKNGAEVKNIKAICWDWVYYPSHTRAYMSNIVNESSSIIENGISDEYKKGLFEPFNTQKVINYITESSSNFKTITESFELLYKDIQLMPDKKSVRMITESGEIFVCKLENHVSNEIMSYCRNFKY